VRSLREHIQDHNSAHGDPAFSAMENSWEQELPLQLCILPRIRSCQILVTGKQQKPRGPKTRTRSGSGKLVCQGLEVTSIDFVVITTSSIVLVPVPCDCSALLCCTVYWGGFRNPLTGSRSADSFNQLVLDRAVFGMCSVIR
jgi:hypothetical protein